MSGTAGSSQWIYNPSTSFYNHTIDQSLRFNDDDSAYLKRTLSGSGNRKTWTLSLWIKRSNFGEITGQEIPIFSAGTSATSWAIFFTADDLLFIQSRSSSSNQFVQKTNNIFRDVNAWYHIVYAFDTTQATDTNKTKLYVNGEQITLIAHSGNTLYPSLNTDYHVNNSSAAHFIGYGATHNEYYDGYVAEVNFIDGTQYDASYFGETKDSVWTPKEYTGSYGANGFHLDFSTSSFTDNGSDPDVFADQAGSNNWNAYKIAASDIVPHSPTNSFATLNSAHNQPNITFSEGNLRHQNSSNNRGVVAGFLLPKSGIWYWEHLSVSFNYPTDHELHSVGINVPDVDLDGTRGGRSTGVTYASNSGKKFVESGTGATYGASWEEGDIVGVEFDADSGTINFSKNGTFQGDISITASKDWLPFVGMGGGTSSSVGIFNFGQDSSFSGQKTSGSANASDANGIGDFYYSPPSSALALCTANLPDPTIGPGQNSQADDNFNTVIWSGNSTNSRGITTGHATDLVWIKKRTTTVQAHVLADSVRGTSDNGGTGNVGILTPDSTAAVSTNSSDSGIASFDSTGFTIGAGSNTANADAPYQGTNASGHTYVGWSWKAGGTAVSNSDGSLTCNVSANTDAGFSIVTWTATNDSGTLGHGLNSAPEMIIAKPLGSGTNWYVMHTPGGVVPANNVLNLDGTTAKFNPGVNHFNDTYPTSTVFSYGGYLGDDLSNDDKVAYCFHSVEGYSKVGSYTGNATNYPNGTFIYTGFRPALVMVKAHSTTSNWIVTDNKRASSFNGDTARLYWNTTGTETAYNSNRNVELFSNGFMVHGNSASDNANRINESASYIYLAFAEPGGAFKFANAR